MHTNINLRTKLERPIHRWNDRDDMDWIKLAQDTGWMGGRL